MASDLAAVAGGPTVTTAPSEDWMQAISRQTKFLSTGDRAALRRLELTRSKAADGIVVKLAVNAKVPRPCYEADFDRWRLLAHIAATLSGTGAVTSHDERRSVGDALKDAGISENRLLRLLSTRGEPLRDQLRLVIRVLARSRKPVDLWTLYHLLGGDEDKAEKARIRIARDYYA